MLAVIGSPTFLPGLTPDAAGEAGGIAAGVARAAAAAGAEVQLVGRWVTTQPATRSSSPWPAAESDTLRCCANAGSATPLLRPDSADADPSETQPLAALVADGARATDGRANGGSARREAKMAWSPAPGLPLEPADISLGLRYLRDFRVLVTADPLDEPSAVVVADAAAFAVPRWS